MNPGRLTPALLLFVSSIFFDMTTAPASVSSLVKLGKLVITRGLQDFVDTGVLPYCNEPEPATLGVDWRRHWLTVCLVSHAQGCWGDTCPEDSELNDQIYHSSGSGGRLMSVWYRSGFPKIWIITEDFNGPDCYTCALFPDEY